VIGAVAMQSAGTQELATVKCHMTASLAFLRETDEMMLLISTKKK
jgi:hypothetical protein